MAAGLSVSCIHLSDQTTGTSGRWSQCVLYTPGDQTTGTSGRWSQCVTCIHLVTRLQVPVAAGLSVSVYTLVTRLQVPVAAGLSVLHTPGDQTTGTSGRWSQCVLYTPE